MADVPLVQTLSTAGIKWKPSAWTKVSASLDNMNDYSRVEQLHCPRCYRIIWALYRTLTAILWMKMKPDKLWDKPMCWRLVRHTHDICLRRSHAARLGGNKRAYDLLSLTYRLVCRIKIASKSLMLIANVLQASTNSMWRPCYRSVPQQFISRIIPWNTTAYRIRLQSQKAGIYPIPVRTRLWTTPVNVVYVSDPVTCKYWFLFQWIMVGNPRGFSSAIRH